MKAKPLFLTKNGYENCAPEKATHIQLNIPGPIPYRVIPVQTKGKRKDTGNWTWNGSVDLPTIRPSILSNNGECVCHTFVYEGMVEFLKDSTHELAGQTIPLNEVLN